MIWMQALLISGALAVSADDNAAIREAIVLAMPQAASQSIQISSTQLAGFREVAIGAQIFYVSVDGTYLVAGPLYDLKQGKNLTDLSLSRLRVQTLANTAVEPRLRYPAGSGETTVTVVTNVDCPYCRRLHTQLAEYQQLGIGFEYVMTPFGGAGSESYNRTAALLCDANPAAAITRGMAGEPASGTRLCTAQLNAHMSLARALGANTTPNFILPDGRLIPGYQTPTQLAQLLKDME